jgi:ribA/ribD-fused uncharacterized protein
MTITDDYIIFYGTDWPSNFAESPITEVDPFWIKERKESTGLFQTAEFQSLVTFRTAEAYYQSRKAVFVGDKQNYYKIARAKTPGETKRIAREIKLDSRTWNLARTEYMWDTIRFKFEFNPELMEKLLDERLEGKKFVEASPTDTFWGVGKSEAMLVRLIEDKAWADDEFDFKTDLPVCENMLGELLTKLRKYELEKQRMTK